jgi:Transglycosylase-like domain
MPPTESSQVAPVRAAGLVLTLFAIGAGAAGAATLSSSPEPARADAEPIAVAQPVAQNVPLRNDIDELESSKQLALAHQTQRVEDQRVAEARAAAAAEHAEHAERVAMWDELAECETGGNWHDGGDYGGGLGIYVGTWRMYGGREFAARPQWASKEQQIAVAERIAEDGYGGWGCAHTLGWVN